MRVLHVGCLPFPTAQGTQAAIASMVAASSAIGFDAHLLTYAGRAFDIDPPYAIHRIADRPRVTSLRSGPSIGKVVLDARMVRDLQVLCERLGPHAILAHHIEGGAVAVAAGVAPVYYVAHTELSEELPTYLPRPLKRLASGAASHLERFVRRRVAGIAAVAPRLAERMHRTLYLPVPWNVASAPSVSKQVARHALGIDPGATVALYAGNLDGYQGWEEVLVALSILRDSIPQAKLLVATASDPTPAERLASRLGLSGAVHVAPLEGEPARETAHASADFAWIPRRTPGGLPIKMLDAFARGVPVVATERATAGLRVDDACVRVPNDDPFGLAQGARTLSSDEAMRRSLSTRGRRYLQQQHGIEEFSQALERLTGLRATRVLPPRSDEVARQAV